MAEAVLQLDARDNVLVALASLAAGTVVHFGPPSSASSCPVTEAIPAKHKMALVDLKPGDLILMYGMVVGEATAPIPRGGLLSTRNVRHRAGAYTAARQPVSFSLPDASAWTGAHLHGLSPSRRPGGHAQLLAGSAAGLLRKPQCGADERGARGGAGVRQRPQQLSPARARTGAKVSSGDGSAAAEFAQARRGAVFPHLDGIRFLTHEGGCGGTRQDAQALCGLLAGYIHHPNVAGATVLSLGCQNAQAGMSDGRVARARSRTAQACAGLRSAADGPRIGADEPGAGRDVCRARGGQPRHALACAARRAHRGTEVRRLGWIQRNLCQPGHRLPL